MVAAANISELTTEEIKNLIGLCGNWIQQPEIRQQIAALGIPINSPGRMTANDRSLLRQFCIATGTPWARERTSRYKGFDFHNDKTRAEESLYEFGQQAWDIVEPGQPFIKGRHIEIICLHLEALANGTLGRDNLLINIPPGHSKSIFTNVFLPAFVWAKDPTKRFLYGAYEQKLSTRDSIACRSIIESDWYKSRWPHVKLVGDQNEKTKFQNSEKGWRIASSVGGSGTGLHPHFIIADDPHDVRRANSEAERQKGVTWWTGTISSRGILVNVKKVVIMQRLHVDDVSGWILANQPDEYDHICLPARFEFGRMGPTSLGMSDWRSVEGELLWPSAFTEEKLRQMELPMGQIEAAGQLQQRPMIKGGMLFKREWFQEMRVEELVGGFTGQHSHFLTARGLFS